MVKKESTLLNSYIIYFIALIIFVSLRIVVICVEFPFDSTILEYISTAFIQIFIMFLLPIMLFSLLEKQKIKGTLSSFKYNKVGFKTIIITILIGFLCYFLNLAVASFFSSMIHLFGFETAPSLYTQGEDMSLTSFFLNVFFVALLPAICEENMHRGLLLKGSSSLGLKNAVILSSVLFGLMHMNINQFFYATILGFIIATSVVVTKSIFPAMIIHFMNNFLSVYFSFAEYNHWLGENVHKFVLGFLQTNNLISFFFSIVFVLVILLGLIIILFLILLKENRIKKVANMLKDIESINNEYNTNQLLNENENVTNLRNLNSLMGQYNIKGFTSMIFTEFEIKKTNPTNFEKILITFCFIVGGAVTALTFIWGMI